MDQFIETSLSLYDLAELYEEDKLKPFNLVKDLIVKHLGEIRSVKVHMTYFNPEKLTAVIEYLVETRYGEVSVKIICSNNPQETLKEYYLYELKKNRVGHS